MGRGIFSLPLLLLFALPLWPQEDAVGMKLADLLERYGAPKAVLAARGNEIWQDDVIFQYAEGDFYIYKDRVWQVKLSSVRGISLGDPKQAALLVMGNAAEDRGDCLLLPVSPSREGAPSKEGEPSREGNWPLMIRVNINNTGTVSSIFIYRSDF